MTDPAVPYRYQIDMGHVTCVRFNEVSGLKYTGDLERVQEGGNNFFEHAMVKPGKYDDLTIKKGFYSRGSEFYTWMRQLHVKTMPIQRVNMSLIIMSDSFEEIGRFNLYKCLPLEYEGPSFNSTAKDIMFESLKVHYDYFEYHGGTVLEQLAGAALNALGNMIGAVGLPGGASANIGG
ncbi:MAG: phage tail protein, partial [Actinobacteria bacterium ATB1]|nr:phage tail protein [Actinobacteria bacterium ATB1]